MTMDQRNEFGETADEYRARQSKYEENRQNWLRSYRKERQEYQDKIEAEKAAHFEVHPLQKLTVYELAEELSMSVGEFQRDVEREALRRVLLWIENQGETLCRLAELR